MIEEPCLLDTNIVSYLLKQLSPAYPISLKYLEKHGFFTISCLTQYECLRGYKAIGATKRLREFEEFLLITDVIALEQRIFQIASDIYGVLKQCGKLPGEFDILIAATALSENLTLITNNEKHFASIQEHFPLAVGNWMNAEEKKEEAQDTPLPRQPSDVSLENSLSTKHEEEGSDC